MLEQRGFVARGGHIVDGSFVEVPKQRNTREENKQIKEGVAPESFEDNLHKKAQKDCDARWARKNQISYYGYKDHIETDVKYKIIRGYGVTAASVRDSKEFMDFFPDRLEEEKERERQAKRRGETQSPEDEVFADSAYVHHGEHLRARDYTPRLREKGRKNKPRTEDQKASNREKSKVRCRVKHIFGAMKSRARDGIMRCVGMARARYQIGMRNLVFRCNRLS
jgi:IS5 family transposase